MAAISKIVATVITYPYMTIRLKQQLKKESGATLTKIITKIYSENGFSGFYKGINEKIVQTTLNAAFLMLFNDFFAYLIKRGKNEICYKFMEND